MFKRFLSYSEAKFPITLSKFLLSNYSSVASSGLSIEIVLDSHGDDEKKYDNFIRNINFDCYAKTAQRFGFKLDKNYPGRLIADVKSAVMSRIGDANLSPSEGGMGYMLKYPNPPDPNPPPEPDLLTLPERPDAPDQRPNTPWRAGDVVEVVVIVPNDPAEKFFILDEYTYMRDQIYGSGVKSKSFTIDGKETTQYDYLVEYFKGYGEPIKYTFKILNPEATRSQSPPNSFPTPVIKARLIEVGNITTLQRVPLPTLYNTYGGWFDVMSINKLFEDNLEQNATAAAARRRLRNSGMDSVTANAGLTPWEINGQPPPFAQGLFAIDLSIYEGVRYLTPQEREDCQTVPRGYTKGLTENQIACILGDGWTIDVIAHIFNGLKEREKANVIMGKSSD